MQLEHESENLFEEKNFFTWHDLEIFFEEKILNSRQVVGMM